VGCETSESTGLKFKLRHYLFLRAWTRGSGGGMSGLTLAPTKRVHDPSGVATHGVALRSAG
jgi:hypothetical protein